MKVLAIDPGNIESAYVLWDGTEIIDKAKIDNHDLLSILKTTQADCLVIEQVKSYGMAVGDTVFDTCRWYGRFEQQWINAHPNKAHSYVPRKTIVTHHCNDPRAKDSNVRQALVDRLGAPGTKKNPGKTYGVSKDIWSALAIAVWFTDTLEFSANV